MVGPLPFDHPINQEAGVAPWEGGWGVSALEVPWEVRMATKARLARLDEERRQEWARYTPWTEARCPAPECKRRADWPGHLVIDAGLCPLCQIPMNASHVYRPLEAP